MQEHSTETIRNVALVGHGSTGKTSLAEALLFKSGAISRLGRVDDGTSTGDFDPDEQKRKMTISLSLLPVEWKSVKINIVDTPGYPDFVGEVRCGLTAADAAVVVVDASAGVQVGTEQVWQQADAVGLPRIVVLNRMDRENADFESALRSLREAFGARCAPLQAPLGQAEDFRGVVDLLRMQAFEGDGSEPRAIPDAALEAAQAQREALLEAVCETDDELIAKYLEGEEISSDELVRALRAGIREGNIVPVLLASAAKVIGVAPLADALADLAPSPLEARPIEAESGALSADPAGPTVLRVFKTTADPYVGRLTYFRVVSGTVTSDSHLMNANTGRDERLSQLFVVCGKSQEPAPRLHAGDIGAVAKLAETGTGDTLCAKGHETKLPPIALPSPVYDVAVSPKTKADLDKLGAALTRIVEEDPTLRVHRDATTGETVLSGLGETHVDVAIERMRRKFGVDVEAHTPRVAYRETIRTKANVEYKHKKQTGGHGQYGHVFLELEPLPRGSGVEFGDRVVGGVVPKNYIPAVEKGVMEAVQEGAIANCPLVDMKVTLYDGSHHPVDSSEMAFKIAASQAMKKGVLQANPALLEPVAALHIQVPEEFVGDVISDLNGKRGQVLGMTPNGSMTTIEAMAPLAEVQRYAIDLRSLTQGRASFSMELDHYDEVPQQLAQKVIDEAHREKVAS